MPNQSPQMNLSPKTNESEHGFSKLWNMLTDNELLPPKGRNLIDLKDLPSFNLNIDEKQIKKIKLTIAVATAILNLNTIDPALATKTNTPINNTELEWALQALEKIDPITYLSYNYSDKSERGVRSETAAFSEEEKNLLTWNLFHEARGEPKVGQLGVLLTVMNKMQSGKHFPDVMRTIFAKFQYSWTLEITKDESELNPARKLDKKDTLKIYLKLRDLVETYTSDEFTFSTNITNLKTEIAKILKIDVSQIPNGLTHYHKLGMLSMPGYLNGVKTLDTFRRVAFLEDLFSKKDPRMIQLGTHIFYPDLSPPIDWKVPETFLNDTNKAKYLELVDKEVQKRKSKLN